VKSLGIEWMNMIWSTNSVTASLVQQILINGKSFISFIIIIIIII
jgi:hypothetical protein